MGFCAQRTSGALALSGIAVLLMMSSGCSGARERSALIGHSIGDATGTIIEGIGRGLFGSVDEQTTISTRTSEDALPPSEQEQIESALAAPTADINADGSVTLGEVVILSRSGLSHGEILARLAATDQVFDLGEPEREYLAEQGVSPEVIASMPAINRLIGGGEEEHIEVVIGKPM